MKRTTKQIALISIFATLIVVVTRLPGIPIIGGPASGGGSIELSVIIYPIIGVILGPVAGASASLIGNIIAWMIPSSTMFGLLLIPAGAIASFVSGCLIQESRWLNWKASALTLALLNGSWYLSPVGFEAPLYPVIHFIALALIIFVHSNISKYIHSSSREKMMLGMATTSYIALMADHMFGNLAWISSIGLVIPLKAVRDSIKALGMIWLKTGIYIPDDSVGSIFMLMLPISTVERLVYMLIATLIGVSLIRSIGWSRLRTNIDN